MLLATLSYQEGQVLRHFYKMAPFEQWTYLSPPPVKLPNVGREHTTTNSSFSSWKPSRSIQLQEISQAQRG